MITLTHDITLDIATGKDRHTKTWRNAPILWSALLDRLSSTHRTPETHKEYLAAKPQRQAEIKDIGGFVGGYLNGGRRKTGHVLHRQLVTLDADYASPDLWGGFTMLYDNAAAVYSTHKHSPEAPRLRILIPLDREVLPDEYVPIARRVADYFGINHFDPTGFRPTQLMYWPSTSKDGEYLFEYQDGPLFSADELLATYKDWKDSSAWPMSEREREIPVQAIRKQGDPLEKPGIIGAFCRTYSIQDALHTFLAEQYSPTEDDNRWTYVHGSTAGGLVLYEDKYAYSHHGTDPVSGKLCNAFDLVRIHLFGLKDEDCDPGTTVTKLPSYAAMSELAASDPEVRKLRGREMLESAQYDFADDLPDEQSDADEPRAPVDDGWLETLERDQKGNLVSTIGNAVIILRSDPRLKNRIGFNLFSRREIVLKDLPWRKLRGGSKDFEDPDASNMRHYMEECYGFSGKEKLNDALTIIFHDNGFHPVKDYFKSLPAWDGTPRVDTVFIDYLGSEDNAYSRAVTRKMLVAAVARIFDPGVKFDNMVVLVGEQGIGKSTVLDRLGVEWFTDAFNFHMLKGESKRGEETIQGSWIVEIGELAGIGKADLESAKSFLSRREDKYRAAYGERIGYHPRQCVFFGTTNNPDFLRDVTGNRRFWPLTTDETAAAKNVFRDLHRGEVAQIWAEALVLYKQGEPLHLTKEISDMAMQMQEAHTELDERAGLILNYLETKLPENWKDMSIYDRREYVQNRDGMAPAGTVPRTLTCAAEIWTELFGGTLKDLNRLNTKFINDVLRSLKHWKPTKGTRKFDLCGYQRAFELTNKTRILTNKTNKESEIDPFD